jgi:hypothetical protein
MKKQDIYQYVMVIEGRKLGLPGLTDRVNETG